MDKDWNTTQLSLNGKLTLWIKSKIENSKEGIIVIEIKDGKLTAHYRASKYVLDIDN